jgi:hypothetical protein
MDRTFVPERKFTDVAHLTVVKRRYGRKKGLSGMALKKHSVTSDDAFDISIYENFDTVRAFRLWSKPCISEILLYSRNELLSSRPTQDAEARAAYYRERWRNNAPTVEESVAVKLCMS